MMLSSRLMACPNQATLAPLHFVQPCSSSTCKLSIDSQFCEVAADAHWLDALRSLRLAFACVSGSFEFDPYIGPRPHRKLNPVSVLPDLTDLRVRPRSADSHRLIESPNDTIILHRRLRNMTRKKPDFLSAHLGGPPGYQIEK